MENVAEIVLPFFTLTLLGFMSRKVGLINAAAGQAINRFVFYFALPTYLFLNMASAPIGDLFKIDIIVVYSGTALAMMGAGLAASRILFRHRLGIAALHGMAASFGNLVFVGVPLLAALLGPEALFPATIVIMFDTAIALTLTTILLELSRSPRIRPLAIARRIGSSLLRSPPVMAILVGVVYGLSGLPLPTVIDNAATLLGRAAAPCALFAIGATLSGDFARSARGEIMVATGLKLIVHPLLVFAAGVWLLPLDPQSLQVAVIHAATPIGANLFVLAGRYGLYEKEASSAILVSTAASVLTLSLAIILLDI